MDYYSYSLNKELKQMKKLNGVELVNVWINAVANEIVTQVQFSNWLENQTDDIYTTRRSCITYYCFNDFLVAWGDNKFRVLPVNHT